MKTFLGEAGVPTANDSRRIVEVKSATRVAAHPFAFVAFDLIEKIEQCLVRIEFVRAPNKLHIRLFECGDVSSTFCGRGSVIERPNLLIRPLEEVIRKTDNGAAAVSTALEG